MILVISKSGPWKWLMSDKIPNVRHLIILRPDRQSTLILLFMALSSLDINKMASKNLSYINRACLQDMARCLRKFLKFYFGQNKRVWYSEIPSLWFRNLIFRTCLGYIRIKVGIFWNLFSFEPNQNFSKWIPQMPFCCVSRNSFFFIFGPFWTLFVFLTFFKHIFMVPIIRKKCEMFIITSENHFLNSHTL